MRNNPRVRTITIAALFALGAGILPHADYDAVEVTGTPGSFGNDNDQGRPASAAPEIRGRLARHPSSPSLWNARVVPPKGAPNC
jgi:hypothetical protein